jgi:hypothetical protein
MESKHSTKTQVKIQDKLKSKSSTTGSDTHTLFVGDDTGLLKKVSLKVGFEDLIISVPNEQPKRRRKRGPEGEPEELDEIAEEVKNLKEEAVIRQQVLIEMKQTGKTGEQVKDQGIVYLRPSLKGDQQSEYLSYVRGKSNIVHVFDTKTDNVLF